LFQGFLELDVFLVRPDIEDVVCNGQIRDGLDPALFDMQSRSDDVFEHGHAICTQ
jgi:hypothetical protein